MTLEDQGVRPFGRLSDAMRRIRTRSIQGGHHEGETTWPLVPPIVHSTVYASHDPEVIAERLGERLPAYNRDHFPNTRMLEELVADLEGAEKGYAVASGMAAVSLVPLALLSQGDHLVMGADSYSDAEDLLSRELRRFGITCSVVDMTKTHEVAAAVCPQTGLVYAETITNPGMSVANIPALAEITRDHDIPLVIDNTFASPALCQPISHGADLVIHSVTKYLGGHHDLSAGVVVGSRRWMDRITQCGYLLGAVPGASDASLAVRGIRTLAPRMVWISQSAQQVATYLATRPEIATVRYPGLDLGDEGELAARMLPDGFGGVMVVEFGGDTPAETACAFVRSLNLIPYAPSLGGEITTVCYPPRLHHGEGSRKHRGERALRFSIGLEDPADVIADMEQAFAAINA